MGIDRTRIDPGIARPDAGQQFVARQHASDVLEEDHRQLELALGQFDISPGQANATPVQVDFDAADGMPVDMVFGLLSPEAAGAAHLHALAAISRMMRDEAMHAALAEAPGSEALYALLANGIERDAA